MTAAMAMTTRAVLVAMTATRMAMALRLREHVRVCPRVPPPEAVAAAAVVVVAVVVMVMGMGMRAGGQAAGRHLGPGLEVNNNRALRLQLASNQNNRSHLARTRSIPTVPLRTCQAHSPHHLFCFCFFGNKKARAGKRTAICALWEREGAFGGLIGTPTSPFERDPKNRWFPYALRARS
jgi:hypothetical protein